MSSVEATGNSAGAGGDDELWFTDGVIGHQQGLFHIRGDRAGNENAVGVPRRGDELDPEPAGIEHDVAERVCFDFAPVAAAGADLTQPQRSAEQSPQLAIERIGFRAVLAGLLRLLGYSG